MKPSQATNEIVDRVLGRSRSAAAKLTVVPSADNQASGKAWNEGLITAAALQSKQFKPVRIILPGLIPEGTTMLAGKPKVGKSWLALDVCLAVADETRFVLGDKKPAHGDVLYLALEDNQRRLKKRIGKIVQSSRWPKRLELHTEWKRMDRGGLEDIEAWCKSVKGPRLIWIDTLAKIRPIAGRNEQAYAADYRAIEGLQKLSGQYQVGIVLNHHLRKMSSEDDAFDDVSGTLGLTGAADTIIIIKRHSGMMKIYVRGRDIEEAELAAEFNRTTCRWRLVGEADDVFRSQERQAILAALKEAGRDKDGKPLTMSVPELMAVTERTDRHALDQMLYRMRKAGEVDVAGRGLYSLPGKDPLNAGEIGEIEGSEAVAEQEATDSTSVFTPDESHHESHSNLTGAESGEIAGEIAETAKPFANNGNTNGSHHLTDLTGIEHSEPVTDPRDPGPMPDFLVRKVPLDRRPALGPEGDSLDDFR
jgi:hypothetical protein